MYASLLFVAFLQAEFLDLPPDCLVVMEGTAFNTGVGKFPPQGLPQRRLEIDHKGSNRTLTRQHL